MRIIDRYLFRQLFHSYIVTLFVVFPLYIIIDLFFQLQDILKNRFPLEQIIQYYLSLSPKIFLMINPAAFLLLVLYLLGTMNKNNELISLKAQGTSTFRISFVIIIFSFLLSLANIVIEDKIIPQTSVILKKNDIKQDTINNNKKILNNFYFYTSSGDIIFAKEFNLQTNELNNVTLFISTEKGEINQEIIAEKISYENNVWIGKNLYTYTLQKKLTDNPDIFPELYLKQTLPLKETPAQILKNLNLNYEDFSLKDTYLKIKQIKRLPAKERARLLGVELQRKIAESFAPFFLVLGSLPFALKIKKRRSSISSLGLAVIIWPLYMIVFSICLAFAKKGIIPIYSVWLANLIMGMIGLGGFMVLK